MPSSDTFSDLDRSVSSVDAGGEMMSGDVSTGAGAEAAPEPEDGFESVAGYRPPQRRRLEDDPAFESAGAADAEDTTGLRDIGEASFGPPGAVLESVHGADDRVQIGNTDSYPWRVHASLRITAADDSIWVGTGWFVGPKLLVTAGHVVYIKNSGVPGRDGWVKRMVVMPGRNASELPFGSTTTSRFWTVTGWADNGDGEYDYGAIELDEPLGDETGWFGFGNWSDLDGIRGNISGYPADKPAGTQWYAGRTIDSATARKVYYDIDTAGGQSGSAVYRFVDGGRYGIAVHAYGGATVNSGTRINSAVFKNIKSWKEASEA